MEIEIVLVKKDNRVILERMLQLYLHEVSLFFPINFNSDNGLYEYDNLDKYFNDSDNYSYFIKCDDKIVGLMLIDQDKKFNFVIQEMFVLNNYKSNGIGKKAVLLILNKFKGNWTIKSLPCSNKAEQFWTKIIKELLNNNYSIEHVGKFNRAIFTFNNLK